MLKRLLQSFVSILLLISICCSIGFTQPLLSIFSNSEFALSSDQLISKSKSSFYNKDDASFPLSFPILPEEKEEKEEENKDDKHKKFSYSHLVENKIELNCIKGSWIFLSFLSDTKFQAQALFLLFEVFRL